MSARCACARRRRGVALFAALSLLALLGLLVAGAFASALLDRRSARFAHADAELTAAADEALEAVLADWDARGLAEIPIGGTRTMSVDIGSGAARATVGVTALPAGLLWMIATVATTRDEASRHANLIARFPLAAFQPEAVLTASGDVELGDDVRFSVDTTGDRGCARVPAADVLLPPDAAISITDTSRTSITIARRLSAADSTRYFLPIDSATRRRNPYLIYVDGDTTIENGDADGVLLVTGHLRITGRFVFSGVVIAGRGMDTAAGETLVRGAVLAFGAPGTPVVHFARTVLQFAPCIATRALEMAHAPHRVRERSWAELY